MKVLRFSRSVLRSASLGLALVTLGICSGEPAQATTLQRMSIEKLTRSHSTVMVGRVVDSFSYWNKDATAILTEVAIEQEKVLKGVPNKLGRTTITLMGGEVDGLRQVILGGAALELGKSYVLFISESDLPGAQKVKTIPGHSQGVFELSLGAGGGLKAVSQAKDLHLVPDANGAKAAPGGYQGLDFDLLLSTVTRVAKPQKEQVNQ